MELLKDFKDQKKQIRTFLIKLAIFILLVFLIDRILDMFLKEGMYKYFGLDKSAKVLAIGHSHTVLGIDKILMEKELNVIVAKYARSGANLQDRKAMIEQYFSLHPKTAKIVLYDVDAHLFTSGGLSRNSYQLFYPFMDTKVIRKHITEAAPPWQELLIRSIFKTSRYNDMLIAQSMRGWLGKWTNFKNGRVDTERLKKEIDTGISRKIELNTKSVKLFISTMKLIEKKGAKVLLVYIPTIDILNDAEPKKFKELIEFFKKVDKDNANISFLNYNELFSHQHDLFFDPVHLNPKGQKVVTEKLIKDIGVIYNVI